MKVIIFGATGMIGHGVLIECLEAPDVDAVVTVGRRAHELQHPGLEQIVHADLHDLSPLQDRFADADACFYCLGVSSSGMSEDTYRAITFDLTVSVCSALVEANPSLTFCFVSGAGTSLDGRQMWARVKAQAEEEAKSAGFAHVYCFRPAFIQPMKGVKSTIASYRVLYAMLGPFYFALKGLRRYVTNTVDVGRAMLNVVRDLPEKTTLENEDIVALAQR